MKKFVSILLILMLTVSLIAGCQSNNSNDSNQNDNATNSEENNENGRNDTNNEQNTENGTNNEQNTENENGQTTEDANNEEVEYKQYSGQIVISIGGSPDENGGFLGLQEAYNKYQPDVELIWEPKEGDYETWLGTQLASGEISPML